MIGFAVCIRRDDGTFFFSTPPKGFATPVYSEHTAALEHARACRENRLDAVVVKVEYAEPKIIGPKRYLEVLA